jgi:hypothetical protein
MMVVLNRPLKTGVYLKESQPITYIYYYRGKAVDTRCFRSLFGVYVFFAASLTVETHRETEESGSPRL